ncbi:MAG: glycine cleavage system aminomethyltransferase GcvT [Candidatus Aminicenantes bacterium]|nr:glycine cleavage system aminomethyltransferase GcvT [Candidatus Aminicenantes bacterium]
MKQTRFNAQHRRLGAKMIEFVGWDMPVEYKGIIDEHLACRTAAGLFDVSHMGEIHVAGKDALAFVQRLSPNDASRLSPGMVQYTALLTDRGTYVDDMLVYCLHPEFYLLVVNASNTDKDYAYIVSQKGAFAVSLDNPSDRYSQLALQGRKAVEILQPLTDVPLAGMKSFTAAFGKVVGKDCLVSRTGYTGEDGFEVYTLDPEPGPVWEAILESGKPHGLQPVGLGARDTLRLEAKLPLYGNDIDDTTTPLEADFKWIVKFKKGDFLGRDVLVRQNEEGTARKLVGFEVVDKGIARPHYPVFVGGAAAGQVASGTFSPLLRKSIGLVYLPTALAAVGTEFEIGIRDKRVKARVIPTPFYKRDY